MKELFTRIFSTLPNLKETMLLEGSEISEIHFEQLQDTPARVPLRAVDGGSACIFDTPSTCIVYARIVGVQLRANMRKTIETTEGCIVVNIVQTAPCMVQATYHPLSGEKQELFTAPISTLTKEEESFSLLSAANSARKILEWKCVLDGEELTVWDGSFTAQNSFEAALLAQLTKKKTVCSLAKSSTMKGNWQVFAKAPTAPWKARIFANSFFCQLHKNAAHIFRIDTCNSALISALIPWANDPVFLGYPYPLILADQLARVSNEEAAGLQMRLHMSVAPDDMTRLGMSVRNAHTILDKMQF